MNIAELENEIFKEDTKALWVFAYGSLCWRPGFDFNKAITGFIKGYERRFWQGNIIHRGTEERPGRVATLVENMQGRVHGIAFEISGDAAIPYLSRRECKLGGYISHFTTFYPANGNPFNVLLYVATSNNPHWLGHAEAKTIARQVINSKGTCGSNVEYVIRLANFMREHFSDVPDFHLFELEKEVLDLIENERLCLKALMGDGEGCISFVKKNVDRTSTRQLQEDEGRLDNFQFSTRIQGTKLRCLNL
ncbi:glutathione-specific gamma-glutamylcyclotransferase 1 isoform X1 [Diorhabda sublineata]|uniref:glutathione-specific gamma-glutamylcyclotransferase 1 isoform X1 n=1 Tax=Diorhabda sublineata TaxID=1163346 RepID=UPI0024E0A30B|nr:glutathione-specific gamma-glutamylcyclotransferase 1 isoform X1 [Diorhabda sublineata]